MWIVCAFFPSLILLWFAKWVSHWTDTMCHDRKGICSGNTTAEDKRATKPLPVQGSTTKPCINKHTTHLSQDVCIWVVGQYRHFRAAGTEYEVPWLDLTGVQSSQGQALMFYISNDVKARVSPPAACLTGECRYWVVIMISLWCCL